jgi:hypothetical protein
MLKMALRGKKSDELNINLEFLRLTKEGKFAKVEKSAIPYARMKEKNIQTDVVYNQYFLTITG